MTESEWAGIKAAAPELTDIKATAWCPDSSGKITCEVSAMLNGKRRMTKITLETREFTALSAEEQQRTMVAVFARGVAILRAPGQQRITK